MDLLAPLRPIPATESVSGFQVRPGLFRINGATPVPGGVGAVTTGVLVGHVIEAALRAAGLA